MKETHKKPSLFSMRPTKRCLQAFGYVGCHDLQSKNKGERERERERGRERERKRERDPVERLFPANCPRCF